MTDVGDVFDEVRSVTWVNKFVLKLLWWFFDDSGGEQVPVPPKRGGFF